MNKRTKSSCLPPIFFVHARVVVDGVPGRDRSVVPSVIQKELPAARLERAEIRVYRVDDRTYLLVDDFQIAIQIEALRVPVRVVVRHLERADRDARAPAARCSGTRSRSFRCQVLCRKNDLAGLRLRRPRTLASRTRPAARSGSLPRRPPCTAARRRRTCTREVRSESRL